MMGKKPNPETAVMPELERAIDEAAAQVACRMSPLEMGLLIHPDARPVALKGVPTDVIDDHLTRYTRSELNRGQFFRVGDRYTFFMDHQAKARRHGRRR